MEDNVCLKNNYCCKRPKMNWPKGGFFFCIKTFFFIYLKFLGSFTRQTFAGPIKAFHIFFWKIFQPVLGGHDELQEGFSGPFLSES